MWDILLEESHGLHLLKINVFLKCCTCIRKKLHMHEKSKILTYDLVNPRD